MPKGLEQFRKNLSLKVFGEFSALPKTLVGRLTAATIT
jgi:hypothetical protein